MIRHNLSQEEFNVKLKTHIRHGSCSQIEDLIKLFPDLFFKFYLPQKQFNIILKKCLQSSFDIKKAELLKNLFPDLFIKFSFPSNKFKRILNFFIKFDLQQQEFNTILKTYFEIGNSTAVKKILDMFPSFVDNFQKEFNIMLTGCLLSHNVIRCWGGVCLLQKMLIELLPNLFAKFPPEEFNLVIKKRNSYYIEYEIRKLLSHCVLNFPQEEFNTLLTEHLYRGNFFKAQWLPELFPDLFLKFDFSQQQFNYILKKYLFKTYTTNHTTNPNLSTQQNNILQKYCSNSTNTEEEIKKIFPDLFDKFDLPQEEFNIILKICLDNDWFGKTGKLIKLFPDLFARFNLPQGQFIIILKIFLTNQWFEELKNLKRIFPDLFAIFYLSQEEFNTMFIKSSYDDLELLAEIFPDLFIKLDFSEHFNDKVKDILRFKKDEMYKLYKLERLFPDLFAKFPQEEFNIILTAHKYDYVPYEYIEALRLLFPNQFTAYKNSKNCGGAFREYCKN